MSKNNHGGILQRLSRKLYRTATHKQLRRILVEIAEEVGRKVPVSGQLHWLIRAVGVDEATRLVDRMIRQESILHLGIDRLPAGYDHKLVCAVYDECVAQAHNINRSGPEAQFRFLAKIRGQERLKALFSAKKPKTA